MTPSIGEDFVRWKPPTGGDGTLGIVDFSIFPHLDHEDLPDNSMANAERWAAGIPEPAYAIDDQTAIKVTDGAVEVVSEGHWKLFTPSPQEANRRETSLSWKPSFSDVGRTASEHELVVEVARDRPSSVRCVRDHGARDVRLRLVH